METNPITQYDFGVHYANGDGVKQDFTKGRYWIHQAALNGYALAQYNLGVMFFDGIGGIQSQQCAVHWLKKSASEDETQAMAQQALLASSGFSATTTPKVYRVLTTTECEQLPNVTFLGWETKFPQNKNVPDQQFDADETSLSQRTAITFNAGLDLLSKNLRIDPYVDAQTEPKAPSIFRQNVRRYFVQLGLQLLGQEPITSLALKDPDEINKPTVSVKDSQLTPVMEEPVLSANTRHSFQTIEHKAEAEQINSLPTVKAPNITEPRLTATTVIPNRSTGETVRHNLSGNLRSASKQHYTLQLSSSSQAKPLFTLATKYKLANYLVYKKQQNGQSWYVLVYGEYPTLSAAKQALKALPQGIQKDKPWVRSLKQVQSELH